MKRAVITGATGTIGLALIQECISREIEVLALVNPGSEKIGRLPSSPLVKVRECGLKDLETFSDFQGCFDAFFHLAWASTNGDAARNCLQPQVLNIKYALDAVDLAHRMKCETFIGAGSQAEYGRTEDVLTPEAEPHPETAYGMAKLCCGQMTRLACRQKGMRHVWPRILSTYGPGSQPQTILAYTMTELLARRSPSLSGCDQIWDFLYVGDAARALYLLAENGRDGEVYVVGSEDTRRLKDYILELKDILEQELGEKLPEIGFGEKPYTETTVMHLECSILKLTRDTGFQPQTSFEDGVRKTLEWMRERETTGSVFGKDG